MPALGLRPDAGGSFTQSVHFASFGCLFQSVPKNVGAGCQSVAVADPVSLVKHSISFLSIHLHSSVLLGGKPHRGGEQDAQHADSWVIPAVAGRVACAFVGYLGAGRATGSAITADDPDKHIRRHGCVGRARRFQTLERSSPARSSHGRRDASASLTPHRCGAPTLAHPLGLGGASTPRGLWPWAASPPMPVG